MKTQQDKTNFVEREIENYPYTYIDNDQKINSSKVYITNKVCTKCGIRKDISRFSEKRTQCRDCRNKYSLERKKRKHKERLGSKVECYNCLNKKNASAFRPGVNTCKKCESIKFKERYHNAKKDNSIKSKICKGCGIDKNIEEYHETNRGKCKECRNKDRKRRYDENPEKYRAEKRAYGERYREELRARKRKKYQEDDEFREKFLKRCKKYVALNSDKRKKYVKKYGREKAIYRTFCKQLDYAEDCKSDKNGFLICSCTYCGKSFYPTNFEVGARINSLNGRTGGENRLYCSKKCKEACPTYGRRKFYKGQKVGYSREIPAGFRLVALKERNWTCEKCGSTEDGLHVHHIEGYTEQPMLSADLTNVLVVCKSCHIKIHKTPGCSTADYKCEGRHT